ncbi:MAG: hypothetical protein K0Q49_1810 [Haloplasmataceae bacterium]|jgi:general stress protein 26|nr:hypothetical protein [Haloplasmataceae bacterium]
MIKENGSLKLNVGNKKRTMNYTTQNQKVHVLTKNNSQKIADIKVNNKVELSFGAKETVNAEANIISDITVVKLIFDKMLSENNTHFNVFKDHLVVIEFTI